MKTFTTDISYTQMLVYWTNLEDPGSYWRKKHVEQGFAWRPGSVSYGMFANGDADVAIRVEQDHAHRPDALRIIEVPFHVPPSTRVTVASLWDKEMTIDLEPGDYRLIFEHGYKSPPDPAIYPDRDMWCDFTFIPVPAPIEPRIIRADPELSPPTPLVMTADPA